MIPLVVEPAGFFVLRTPLLPFDTLTQLSDAVEAPAALVEPARLPDACARDRVRVCERLRALVGEPAIREAIFVASPDLDRAIERWLADPADPRAAATERAVMRYVTRMASRATPFGLFAASGVGAIGTGTSLSVSARPSCQRHTRLDMDYLVALADALARDPALAQVVRYTPNSSLYRSADRWRLVETRIHDRNRTQHLVSVEDSAELSATIARARDGASRADLAAALVGDDITLEDADAFVRELIDSQILVPDVECPVTGPEPLAHLIDLLRRAPEGDATRQRLAGVDAAIGALDSGGVGSSPRDYRAIAAQLESFPVTVDLARLFQVDLVRPAPSATLDRSLVDEMMRGVSVLRRLMPPGDHDQLARFRTAFADRYERRDVPLLEVLDEEAGIGGALADGGHRDASPLLRGLEFPVSTVPTLPWTAREALLLHRVGQALVAGAHELALTDRDVDEMTNRAAPPMPDAYAVMATIIPGGSDTTVDARVLLHYAGGPSGANLLGRFCHADAHLLEQVRTHLRHEAQLDPDAIYAEVVHLPEGRLGNILLRPLLRDYEIAYLGRSGAPLDRQIAVTDLTLRLSDDGFVLYSRRLARRIVPRLTSAHNFTRLALNVYRLLCLLQSENRLAGCNWTWGALAALPFLPRVTYGRLVFARATWRMTRDDIRSLKDAKDGAPQYQAVQHWRRARRLPRWVVLSDYDNTLPIDLDNALAVDSLIQVLKEREFATLTELYPGPDELIAQGADGRYAHELLIPVAAPAKSATTERAPLVSAPRAVTVERTFAPGSEWIFAKAYSGASAADRLLSQVVGPISRKLHAKGLIDRWFFIRYADPDEHLRWRLHAHGSTRPATIQRHLERALAGAQRQGLIRRVVFDTYEREIERYGGQAGILPAEEYFCADSETIVDLLDADGAVGADAGRRWHAAIPGVDTLLADLGLDQADRLRVAQRLRDAFGREFHVDAAVARQLAARYRSVKSSVEPLLDRDSSEGAPFHVAFARRSARACAALASLQDADRSGQLDAPLATIAESYVHMHLNRLFRAEQRAHELVIYDFLVCLYEGRVARERARGR